MSNRPHSVGDPGRGRFFVLDGVDGCGKSTQAASLCERLAAAGCGAPLHLREPGGTRLGEALREVLLSREFEIEAGVESLLFCASRAQMLNEQVEPALAAGQHVVCERGNASTFAYQCAAGELDEKLVLNLLGNWAGAPKPTLEILLGVDVQRASERRGNAGDRIEDKGLGFQSAVARGYERYFELAGGSGRVVKVSGEGSAEDVGQLVWEETQRVL